MGRLIKLQDIDQFFEVVKVPDAAVTQAVLEAVKQLDERHELEPMLRQILYDPTETPHGPTEIADILTTKLRLRGEKCLAAFVLKGKSYQKVRPADIAHQVIRLRQLPDLRLAALVAVGDIQDAAMRDFVQVAVDGDYDYLVVDASDCSRLLIAYEKICPTDGSLFGDDGRCAQGHAQSPGIELKIRVREGLSYEVIDLRDVSHAGARRLSAKVLVNPHYDREILREIIRDVTHQVRGSSYHRSDRVAQHWGDTDAHVVWLFLAGDLSDVRNFNWVARTEWIDATIDPAMRPLQMDPDETVADIAVSWNNSYKAMREFYSANTVDKGEFLRRAEPIVSRAGAIGDQISRWWELFEEGSIDEAALIDHVRGVAPEVEELLQQGGTLPLPPQDARDYDSCVQGLFGRLHDMTLYYSERGLETWPLQNRTVLMRFTVRDLTTDWDRVRFEHDKLHR